jgi:hypothetical protein
MQYNNYHKEPTAKFVLLLHGYPAQNLLNTQEAPCEELLCFHVGKGHYGLLIIKLTMLAQVFYTPNCDFFDVYSNFFFCSSYIFKT